MTLDDAVAAAVDTHLRPNIQRRMPRDNVDGVVRAVAAVLASTFVPQVFVARRERRYGTIARDVHVPLCLVPRMASVSPKLVKWLFAPRQAFVACLQDIAAAVDAACPTPPSNRRKHNRPVKPLHVDNDDFHHQLTVLCTLLVTDLVPWLAAGGTPAPQ